MKKINFILSLLLLWIVGATNAGAVITDNYKEVFNTPIDTSDPEFIPAMGWGHYTEGFEKNQAGALFHPAYKWYAKGLAINGVTYSYIDVSTQQGKDAYNDFQCDKDMLITPVIYGKSSFYAKCGNNCFLRIYKMKEKNGKWVPDGEPIADFASQLDRWNYKKMEIPEVNGERLGIYASMVQFGIFEAEQVDIPETKQLLLFGISSLDKYANADNDGNYTISVTASVKNTGNVDLTTDEPNYSVSIVDSKNQVIVTKPIGKALAAGESTEIELSYTRKYADFKDTETISLVENVCKKSYVVGTYIPVSNEPKFQLFVKGEGTEVAADATFNFGKTRNDVYKKFTIMNDGGGALNITSIDLPEGFSTSFDAASVAVEPHTSKDFSIILKGDVVGVHEGTVKLNAGDLTKEIKVKGETAPETTWTATFEDKKLPVGSRTETNGGYGLWECDDWYKSNSKWGTDNDKTTLNVNTSVELKFITPRLKFAEGETFEFDAARSHTASYDPQTTGLTVYYSADGNSNWKVARTIDISELPTEKDMMYKPARFVIDNIPAGSWYIGIGAAKGEIDNLVGGTLDPDAHSWALASAEFPEKAEVNSVYTASVKVTNVNPVAEKADTYKAKLYVDDELVSTANGVDIAPGENGVIELSFTPHATGDIKAKIVVEATDIDYSLTTDEATVTVNKESALSHTQVGKFENEGSHSPLYTYNEKNESEVLYPASKLTGLKKGDKIAKIVFRAKSRYSMKGNKVLAWIENTEDETLATPFEPRNTEEMTKVFDGLTDFDSCDGNGNDFGDFVIIDFDAPFVYDGKGLRLHISQELTQGYGGSSYFEVENDKTLCYNRNCYRSADISKYSYYAYELPVAHFYVALDPKVVSSTVTDKSGNAIAGAKITLKSDNIEYYAVSDATGKYTTNVLKGSLAYGSTIEAQGYKKVVAESVDLDAPAAAKMDLDKVVLAADTKAFCVAPMDVPASDLSLVSAKTAFYELASVADGKANFNIATQLAKNNAYLVVAKEDGMSVSLDMYGDIDLANEKTTAVGDADVATYLCRRQLTAVDGKKTFRAAGDKFVAVNFDETDPTAQLAALYAAPFEAVINVASDADELEIVLNDTPSGITNINAAKANAAGNVYTVEGVQVSNKGTKALKPGLYIVNGKKVVVK